MADPAGLDGPPLDSPACDGSQFAVGPVYAVIGIATSLYDYTAETDSELSFAAGTVLYLVEDCGDWLLGYEAGGTVGAFPASYCEYHDVDSAETRALVEGAPPMLMPIEEEGEGEEQGEGQGQDGQGGTGLYADYGITTPTSADAASAPATPAPSSAASSAETEVEEARRQRRQKNKAAMESVRQQLKEAQEQRKALDDEVCGLETDRQRLHGELAKLRNTGQAESVLYDVVKLTLALDLERDAADELKTAVVALQQHSKDAVGTMFREVRPGSALEEFRKSLQTCIEKLRQRLQEDMDGERRLASSRDALYYSLNKLKTLLQTKLNA